MTTYAEALALYQDLKDLYPALTTIYKGMVVAVLQWHLKRFDDRRSVA
jgi:hypothetical protein